MTDTVRVSELASVSLLRRKKNKCFSPSSEMCQNGYTWDLSMNLEVCVVAYSAACNGTIYPEASIADVKKRRHS